MGTVSPTPSELKRTILFDENAQAIDHVLSELLRMNTETIEKVKLWFAYNNVRSMSHLIDLYLDSPENITSPDYRVGSTKEYLDKWSCVSLTLICKMGEHLIRLEKRMLENQDWLNFSRVAFDHLRVHMISTPVLASSPTPQRTPAGSVSFPSPGIMVSQSPSQEQHSIKKITIPSNYDGHAIDHILSNVIQLTNLEVNQTKLWFASYNIKSLPMLLELFRACPEKLKIREYRPYNVKSLSMSLGLFHACPEELKTQDYRNGYTSYISNRLCVTLIMICRVADFLSTTKNREMTTKDWLNLTKLEYEEAKVRLIINTSLTVHGKQSPHASHHPPEWYPRTDIIPHHAAITDDAVMFQTKLVNTSGKGEHKDECITVDVQTTPHSPSKGMDSAHSSPTHAVTTITTSRPLYPIPIFDFDKKWPFRTITGHQGPLLPTAPAYKGSRYNVKVLWETGEMTFEPLSIFSRDAPLHCALYAEEHQLLDDPGWKHLRRYSIACKRHDSIQLSNAQEEEREDDGEEDEEDKDEDEEAEEEEEEEIGEDYNPTLPSPTASPVHSPLAHHLHAMLVSEHHRTQGRLTRLRSQRSTLAQRNTCAFRAVHPSVSPCADNVIAMDKGETTCDAKDFTNNEDNVYDLNKSHHSLLNSSSTREYSNSGLERCETHDIEPMCDNVARDSSHHHDQSIQEALGIIERSLQQLHQSLSLIKEKRIDPLAMPTILQQARNLQMLVTVNSQASTFSSITSPSESYDAIQDFIYDPWDTGDPYVTPIKTPSPRVGETTVVSLESKSNTHQYDLLGIDSISQQVTLPEFNDMPFVLTDQGILDPPFQSLEEPHFDGMHFVHTETGPPGALSHVRDWLDSNGSVIDWLDSNGTQVTPTGEVAPNMTEGLPPDPSLYTEQMHETNALYCNLTDWKLKKPPDPSKHSLHSKRGIPGTGEQLQEKKKMKTRNNLTRDPNDTHSRDNASPGSQHQDKGE
jgi:hypothetical protein